MAHTNQLSDDKLSFHATRWCCERTGLINNALKLIDCYFLSSFCKPQQVCTVLYCLHRSQIWCMVRLSYQITCTLSQKGKWSEHTSSLYNSMIYPLLLPYLLWQIFAPMQPKHSSVKHSLLAGDIELNESRCIKLTKNGVSSWNYFINLEDI